MSENSDSRILVLIPVFNASRQISKVVIAVSESIAEMVDGLLILDNMSLDFTLISARSAIDACAIKHRYLFQNYENRGLGGSLKIGFEFAIEQNYTHVLVVHGDNQAKPSDFLKVLTDVSKLKTSKVYGSRFMDGSVLNGYSRIRQVGNKFLNVICSQLMGRRILDLGSGLNLYRTEYLNQDFIYGCKDDLTFNNEILLSEPKPVMTECYVPISWTEFDQRSNAKVVRQGMRTLYLAFNYGLLKKKRKISKDGRSHYKSSSYRIIYSSEENQ